MLADNFRGRLAAVCGAASALAITLTACASVNSQRDPGENDGSGLLYYMPKRDFLVTVVREGGKYKEIKLAATSAYADLNTPRVLRYNRGLLATNRLDITVSEAGLLTSAKSNGTIDKDSFATIGTGLGNLAGLNAMMVDAKTDAPSCNADGPHIFILPAESPDGVYPLCGRDIRVMLKRAGWNKDELPRLAGPTSGTHAGVFYRQNRPYTIVATGPGVGTSDILQSPSESSEMFLPISRTLFTSNDAQISLEHGVPKAWVQETDSELVGLFTIPAKMIGPYFEAIGKLFAQFSTNSSNEASALAAATQLELAKVKFAACLEAIKDDNKALIESLKCGGP